MRSKVLGWMLVLFLISGWTPVGAQSGLAGFWCIDGERVVQSDGEPVLLKGISVECEEGGDAQSAWLIYEDIASMGFNSARLQMSYQMFESDDAPYAYKESGWATLDAHVAAAGANGIRLVLNMHFPQGGYQSGGEGDALWLDSENQQRLIALWTAIAQRYANDPTVVGYSALSEPRPIAQNQNAASEAWQALTHRLSDAIRSVDNNHILFVEQLGIWTTGDGVRHTFEWSGDNRYGFPDMGGVENVIYEFHQYTPYYYTHQADNWVGADIPYLVYPNNFYAGCKDIEEVMGSSEDNDTFDIDTPYWQALNSSMVTIDDPDIQFVRVGASLWELGESGEVWMDELALNEYDENGMLLGCVLYLSFDSQMDMALYSETGEGYYVPTGGVDGMGGTLYLRGVVGSGVVVLEEARVPVTQGHSYQLTFSMGGAGLTYASTISPIVMMYKGGEPITLSREYLAYELDKVYSYAHEQSMPLYMGEFGTNLNSFANGHGGELWVRDMIELLLEREIGFNYFMYRNDYFGVYKNDWTLCQPLRSVLVELLK